MKKMLSVILVLCMLFVSSIAMTSCDLFGGSTPAETTDQGSDDTTVPAENDDTTVPEENDDTTVPEENDDTTVPEENDDTTVPEENDDTTVPGGNDEPSVPGEEETTVPEENDDTTVPGGDNEPTVPGGEETTVPGGDNEPSVPGEEETTVPGGDNNPEVPGEDDKDPEEEQKPVDSEAAQNLKMHAIELFNAGLGKSLVSFYDVANVFDTINGMEKGAIRLVVNNEMLAEEMGIGTIMESFYFDVTGGRFGAIASETLVDVGGEFYNAFIYLDPNTAVAGGNAIFGNDSVYALDIQNIVENFVNSELMQSLEEEEGAEDAEAFVAGLEMFVEAWNKLIELSAYDEELSADMLAWSESLLWNLDPVVTAETINGESALRITYTVNNETVGKLLDALLTTLPESYYEKTAELNTVMNGVEITVEDMKAMMSEGYAQLFEAYDQLTMNFNVLVSFALADDDGALLNVSLVGNLDDIFESEEISYDWVVDPVLNISFSDEKIVLEVGFEYLEDDTSMGGNIVLTTVREVADGVVSFHTDLDVSATNMYGEEMVKEDVLVLLATYCEDGGELTLEIAAKSEGVIYDEENDEYITVEDILTAGVDAYLTAGDGIVSFGVDRVWSDSFEMTDIGVNIMIDTTALVPDVPADAVEVLGQTAEEWQALFEDFQAGPLWQFIQAMKESMEEADMLYGEYVCNDGTFFRFDKDGTFEYYMNTITLMDGYYYIENGGSLLVLEYWDEELEEWGYITFQLSIKGDVLLIDESVYRYVDPNSAVSFRIGTCVSAEGDFYTFRNNGTFDYGYENEIAFSGTYEFTFSDEGVPVLRFLYTDDLGVAAQDDYIIANFGEFILIGNTSYIYQYYSIDDSFGPATNGGTIIDSNVSFRPVQMK